MTKQSYVHGVSDSPLLGETIGENLRRTVERFPDREAVVAAAAAHGLRLDEAAPLTRGALLLVLRRGA